MKIPHKSVKLSEHAKQNILRYGPVFIVYTKKGLLALLGWGLRDWILCLAISLSLSLFLYICIYNCNCLLCTPGLSRDSTESDFVLAAKGQYLCFCLQSSGNELIARTKNPDPLGKLYFEATVRGQRSPIFRVKLFYYNPVGSDIGHNYTFQEVLKRTRTHTYKYVFSHPHPKQNTDLIFSFCIQQ